MQTHKPNGADFSAPIFNKTKIKVMKIMYNIEYYDVVVEKTVDKTVYKNDTYVKTIYKYGVKYPKESEMRFFATMNDAKNNIISQKRLEIEKLSKRIETLKKAIKKTQELAIIEGQIIELEKFFTK